MAPSLTVKRNESPQDAAGQSLAASPCSALWLERVKRTHPEILANMAIHYSQPKGFVGRNICYLVMFGGKCFGSIAGGSATRFLPNREVIRGLNHGINNIFFHIEPRGGYPTRNFAQKVLKKYRTQIERDWLEKYGEEPMWHETLVELPRIGECYKRDGWEEVGQTIGYTCKRTSGNGTDSWSGKRVWDTKNLRPKRVFTRIISQQNASRDPRGDTRVGVHAIVGSSGGEGNG